MEEDSFTNKRLCACGCGQEVKGISKHNKLPVRFKSGHFFRSVRGSTHHNWKGGRLIDGSSYIRILEPDNPHANRHGYVLEHRLLMEKHIGRYLDPKEVVHHINGNKQDNRIENLQLMKNLSEHRSQHKLDPSNRTCLICHSNKAYFHVRRNYYFWYKYNDGWICNRCYCDQRRMNLRL